MAPFNRLARMEVQSVMHFLPSGALRFLSRVCRTTISAAEGTFRHGKFVIGPSVVVTDSQDWAERAAAKADKDRKLIIRWVPSRAWNAKGAAVANKEIEGMKALADRIYGFEPRGRGAAVLEQHWKISAHRERISPVTKTRGGFYLDEG